MSACRAGRRRTRAPGILFRNVIRRASIKEDAIACGTGQQDVRSRAGCFRTARRRVVLLSAQIAAEGRLGAMSTEPQRTCPSCGNEFSGAMEFCPDCMLRKALAGAVESGESSVLEDTVKPTPGQAVERFVTKMSFVYAFGGDLCALGGWTVTIDGSRNFGGYLAIVYTFVGGTWKIRASVFKYPTS